MDEKILRSVQPEMQYVIQTVDRVQREISLFQSVQESRWVDREIVQGWDTYRDAVVWCWEHRTYHGLAELDDQALFARNAGVHAPHMSRYVKRASKERKFA